MRLFVSEDQLSGWTEEGKIELAGDYLTVPSEGRSFHLRPGVRFLAIAAGSDRHGLVGKVKSEEQVRGMGAELYRESVLMGDDAYDVLPGFLAEAAEPTAKADGATTALRNGPTAPDLGAQSEIRRQEEEGRAELARFLLEGLS